MLSHAPSAGQRNTHIKAVDATILIAQTMSTAMMTAIIWFVQVVHYPLFSQVGRDAFASYEQSHTVRITPLVATLMGLEVGTAGAMLVLGSQWASVGELWLGAALLAVIWLSTIGLQVPAHRRLVAGYDEHVVRRLVSSNWIRTGAWTLRLWLVLTWLVRATAS